jgi:hypothetical protein
VRLVRHIALVISVALVSGVVVSAVAEGIHVAAGGPSPYTCRPVVIKVATAASAEHPSHRLNYPMLENCGFSLPWWVWSLTFAAALAGGAETVFFLRCRRHPRGSYRGQERGGTGA